MILGSLDGIETGVRQLIRQAPLETTKVTLLGEEVTLPTLPEMLRIKAILILKRNATRDYLDFAALADALGPEGAGAALSRLDELYPQDSGQSALQQLLVQISAPLPYDLEDVDLSEYKNLDPRWHSWGKVREVCSRLSSDLFETSSTPRSLSQQLTDGGRDLINTDGFTPDADKEATRPRGSEKATRKGGPKRRQR